MITPFDVGWIVGLYEGEGSISSVNGRKFKLQITQKDPEILHRLIKLVGGQIYPCRHWWIWNSWGAEGFGIMMTIYPYLSNRRKRQLKPVIDYIKTQPVNSRWIIKRELSIIDPEKIAQTIKNYMLVA